MIRRSIVAPALFALFLHAPPARRQATTWIWELIG